MNIASLRWIPGGIATILTIYAIYITILAAKKLAGELKSSILYLMSALIFYLLMGITTGIYSITGIEPNYPQWLALPILALIGSILFLVGAKKLFTILTEATKHKKSKNFRKRKRNRDTF